MYIQRVKAMKPPRCMATMIGSMPHADPREAVIVDGSYAPAFAVMLIGIVVFFFGVVCVYVWRRLRPPPKAQGGRS